MKKKKLLLFCVVLEGGLGDFGNMLNFSNVLLDSNPHLLVTSFVLCVPTQLIALKKIAKGMNPNINFEFIVTEPEFLAYNQENVYHYGVPGPGLVTFNSKQEKKLDSCDSIIEFPVAYPLKEKAFKRKWLNKITTILEYGRDACEWEPSFIRTGLGSDEQGILFQPLDRFNASFDRFHDKAFKQLLLGRDSPESYRQMTHLFVAHLRHAPIDPENRFLLHFIFLCLFCTEKTQKNIDIFCTTELETLDNSLAILYEYGVRDIFIYRPNKKPWHQTISLKNLPSPFNKQLKEHKIPNKTCRIFSGFSLPQTDFQILLTESTKSASPLNYTLSGGCGDGSLTDILSLMVASKKTAVIPCIKPVLDYQHATLRHLSDFATEKAPEIESLLQKTCQLNMLNGFDLLDLSKRFSKLSPQIKQIAKALYAEKQLIQTLKL